MTQFFQSKERWGQRTDHLEGGHPPPPETQASTPGRSLQIPLGREKVKGSASTWLGHHTRDPAWFWAGTITGTAPLRLRAEVGTLPGLGVGVTEAGLRGPWGGLRAGDEVTEERVPFLEMVSEPLGQGRVRGATASSLMSLAGSSRAVPWRRHKRTSAASSPSPTRAPTTAPATTAAPGPLTDL